MTIATDPQSFLAGIPGQLLLARALSVAVGLDIADHLADGPRPLSELADLADADRDSLYRLLRMLAGLGVFAEDADGRFELTPTAELLRSDHPDSMRELFIPAWQNIQWRTYEALPEAVAKGKVAFELAHEQPFFDYLAANPELNAAFDQRMAAVSQVENERIAEVCRFEPGQSFLDIGGGTGGLVAAILADEPDLVAALFEQPQVLADPVDLREADLVGRVARIAGDFFDEIPGGFDAYLLKRVLHDWNDEQVLAILSKCHDAMSPDTRLFAIDAVIRSGNEPDPNKNMDLSIMALTPGRERTEAEFRLLFEAAGLEVVRIHPAQPPSTLSVIEGKLAVDSD